MRRLVAEPQLWLAFLAPLVLLGPSLLSGHTLFFRDLHLQYAGTARLLQQLFHEREIPLWDPYLNGGQPLLGNPNRFVLYPTRLLYALLPPIFAMNVEIAGHLALGAVGIYVLARRVGVVPVAALVGGIAFSLSGFSLSLTNFMGRLCAYHWLPWVVLGVIRLVAAPRRTSALGVAAALVALQWMTGGLEIVMMTGATTMVVALAWGNRPWLGRLAWTSAAWALGAGMAAIQVLPAAAMVRQSRRGSGLGASRALEWSLQPRALIEAILPGVLGPVDAAMPQVSYWGSSWVDFGFPNTLSIYVGLVTMALAFAGATWQEAPVSRRIRHALALTALAGGALACGRHLPGLAALVSAFPWLAVIRFPVKLLALAGVPLALLSAVGAHRFVASRLRPRTWALALGVILVPALAGIAVLSFRIGGAGPRLLAVLFGRQDVDVVRGVRGALAHVAAFAAAAILLAWLGRPRLRAALLVALVFCDLATAGRPVLMWAPRDLLNEDPAVVGLIRGSIGGGRFYRGPDPPVVVARLAEGSSAAVVSAWLAVLRDYTGTAYLVPMIYHGDDEILASRRIAAASDLLRQAPWSIKLRLCSIARVTVLMLPQRLSAPGMRELAAFSGDMNVLYHLYVNEGAMPAAWYVPRAEVAASESDALARLSAKEFSPRAEVILEERVAIDEEGGAATVGPWRRRSASRWDFDVDASRRGYLVFSEPWRPGWHIRIDGVPARLLPANYAFCAVPIGAGHHRIVRFYRPLEYVVGALVSLASLTGWIIVVVSRRRRAQPLDLSSGTELTGKP